MDTKKFKVNTSESVKNGRKIGRSTILSKAGFTVVGGISGAAFATVHGWERKQNSSNDDKVSDAKTEVQHPVENQAQNVHSEVHEVHVEDNITEPQPIDSNQTQDAPSQVSTSEDDIDPELIAQTIAQEVDENDIDAEYVFTPDSYDYAYLPDGTRQMVIIGHTPDGTRFTLADVDGDGSYGDIFDMDGNFVAEVDGLSISDIIEMIDDTGGYLAGITEPWNDDPTEPLDYEDELAEIEEVDEDELFAQLTENVDDEDNSETDKFFEDETEEPEEEAEVTDDDEL